MQWAYRLHAAPIVLYVVVFENVWQNIAIKEIISPYKLNTLYYIVDAQTNGAYPWTATQRDIIYFQCEWTSIHGVGFIERLLK